MDFAKVLPMAFVMIAGPQIISAFFFATSEDWKRESAAYVSGALLSITAMTTVGFLLASNLNSGGGSDKGISWGIVALLVYAMVQTFRKRGESEPPKWMGKLQNATPKLAFVLGFMLLGFFPSDIVTSLSVGAHLGNNSDPWWNVLPFVFLTLLLLSLPALGIAMLGQRAKALLPKIRDWMNDNSWIVSEFVIVFFIIILLTG
jgi:threonine/homoserine/homoserine lactone efflux protein